MAHDSESTRIYPRWMYHPTYQPTVVDTPEAEEALGSGWVDTPHGLNTVEEEAETCPYCEVYKNRISEMEAQIIELEKAKA